MTRVHGKIVYGQLALLGNRGKKRKGGQRSRKLANV